MLPQPASPPVRIGTTAGTVAAGDDSRLVANGAITSTTDTGVTWQVITSPARQILMRWRDAVAAAASGVASAWAGLEVAIGIKAPVINASQSVTINAETLTGGNDGVTAWRVLDSRGYIIARLLLSGLWEVPSLLVRGAATFSGAAGLAVQKLSVGAEALVSTTQALSLWNVVDPAGRVVMRLLNTGRLEVPSIKAGIVIASRFYLREPAIPTQVGISADAISTLNANLPTMPSGSPPAPTLSASVATYGPTTRHASESMGVAVTGDRVWAAFYGQNSVVGQGAEIDSSYVVLAYCDTYPAGPWTECLYVLPTAYTGSGGAGVGSNIDPVLYATSDGRLLVMWKGIGINNVADTTVTNSAVMALLIQNPQATAGSFIVGRINYLGVGRPEAPGVLGNDVYMLNDSPGGSITWGRLTASGADAIAYTPLNTLPSLPGPAGVGLECSWAPLSGGRVMALFRTASDGLYTMTSLPGVTGWNTAVKWTAWPNPSGGVPAGARACIIRLPSGLLAIGFNWHASLRYNMSLTLSADGGVTWPYIALVDTTRGKGAYPALAFDNAGRILMAEDYQRANSDQEMIVWRVDEQSILAGSPLIEKSVVVSGIV
jgi:hypothetical protein